MNEDKRWTQNEWKIFKLFLMLCFFIIEADVTNIFNHYYRVYTAASVTSEPRNEKELVVQSLIKEFIEEANKRHIQIDTSKLTFSFAKDLNPSPVKKETTTLGTCNTHFNHIRVLDTSSLELLSNRQIKAVLFHELGHCLLNLNHDENELTVPNIMQAIVRLEHEDWADLNKKNPKAWSRSLDYLFDTYQNHISYK